jgi:hypothetical protein
VVELVEVVDDERRFATVSSFQVFAADPFLQCFSIMRRVKDATRLTKSARETPSVPHVGVPANR